MGACISRRHVQLWCLVVALCVVLPTGCHRGVRATKSGDESWFQSLLHLKDADFYGLDSRARQIERNVGIGESRDLRTPSMR